MAPTTDRTRHAATWLLLAGSIAAALVFLAVKVIVPSDGARVAFYADGWSTNGIAISPIDEPAAGLRPGDVVTAVDGRPVEDWLREVADPSIPRPPAGAGVPYALDRDGSAIQPEIVWTAPALGGTLLAGWSVILFSVATAIVAAFVLSRRPDEPATIALVLAACGAAGSSVPWFLGVTVSDVVHGYPFVLHALVTGPLYMLMWPAGLHLALVFPRPRPVVRNHRRLVPAVYAVTLGAYALATVGLGMRSSTALEWVGAWPLAQVAVVVPATIVTLVLFAHGYLRSAEPAMRARMRLASLGLVMSALLGLSLFMLPELVLGRPLLPEGAIGLIALPLPLGFAAAILRDHLFDIDAAINRTLVYGGLTLAVLATYVLATAGITAIAGADRGYIVSLLATGAAALAALPARDALQRAVNRLMYGQRDEPWRAMGRLAARLEWAVDIDGAFPAIADTVADAMRLPYVAVAVTDELGRSEIVAEHGAPVSTTESVDLVHAGEKVGRLVLGVRAGERAFRPQELALLRDLARQAGAAVHAQRLRRDLARSRERLVVAREEERRRLRHDLHDGLGPALAAIGMRAEAAAVLLETDPPRGRAQLDVLAAEVGVAVADLRRLVDGLRPPALDELGLLGAIGQQAARLDAGMDGAEGTVGIRVEAEPPSFPALPAAVEVAAYRIAVEAMTNVVRHAGARQCRVRLEAGSQLTIEVDDDGRGIAPGVRPGTGLESIRERASELGGMVALEPRPGGGTRLLARLPITVGAGA